MASTADCAVVGQALEEFRDVGNPKSGLEASTDLAQPVLPAQTSHLASARSDGGRAEAARKKPARL